MGACILFRAPNMCDRRPALVSSAISATCYFFWRGDYAP